MRVPCAATVLLLPIPCLGQGSPGPGPSDSTPVAAVRLERVSAAVPWPRGVRFVDGKLYAIARGVHRSAGGPQAEIEDQAGTLFVIDPAVSEPVVSGQPVGDAVRRNAEIVAIPSAPPFRLWNKQMPAIQDMLTDRPYCMLVYDDASQNFFICGYAGIDLPGNPRFRKNPTDSIHRYDRRDRAWHIVEAHDPKVVPAIEQRSDIKSAYYPHHDIAANSPPHGLVNGPCGAVIAGKYLYIGAKDNSALAQYDLTEIRRSPDAPPPPARFIFEGSKGNAVVSVRRHGAMTINGTCALAVYSRYLYVAFRTTSQILRFPLRDDGGVVEPLEGEYIAQFSCYDPVKQGGSADIYDMEFDAEGYLYVSPGYDGAIYRFKPDPARLWNAQTTKYTPFVDLTALAGAKRSGNICFDTAGNLYICSGQKVLSDSKMRGVIYRVRMR